MASGKTYLYWIKQLPEADSDLSSAACPSCGNVGLRFQYFGPDSGQFGWKIVWCETCWSGINVSRIRLPDSAFVIRSESQYRTCEPTIDRIDLILE